MNNTTVMTMGEVISDRWFSLFKYSLYYIIGGMIVVSNSLIFVAIVRHSALRAKKEYIMVAGLALADVLNGSGYLCAGIYRSYLIVTQQDLVLVSAWTCMYKLHNMFFIVGEPASGILLTCVNLDRVIAVASPLMYYKLGRRYALWLNVPFYAMVVMLSGWGVLISYSAPDVAIYEEICFTGYAYNRDVTYSTVYNWVRSMGGLVSVVMFAVVWVMAKRLMGGATAKVADSGKETKQNAQQEKAQRRMTMTIGISSFFTLVLFVIPNFAMIWVELYVTGVLYDILVPLLMSVANLNAVANFFIYSMRHKDMRFGITYLLTCKELTQQQLMAITQNEKTQAAKSVHVK